MKQKVIICTLVKRKNINSAGDFETLKTDDAKLIHQFASSNAGNFSVQQLDLVTDTDVATAADLQTIPQLFELTDSEGTTFTWGDAFYKSRCVNCVREGDFTKISFKRESVNFDL